jgi:large subunit ribosomal protein L22
MGSRSRNRAENRKEEKKTLYAAKLNNCPSSPRKMRLVADLVRGKRVELALSILKNSPQAASEKLHKLLLSAISNWQAKNEGVRIEDSDLYVKEISVDGGRMLKRIQPAPQGRAHRVRKRSNHVTLIVDARNKPEVEVEEPETEEATENQ